MPKEELVERTTEAMPKKQPSFEGEVAELWKIMPEMKGKESEKANKALPSCEFFDSAAMPANGPSPELVKQATTEVESGDIKDASSFDRLFDMKGVNTSAQDFVLQDNLNAVNDQLRQQGSAYRLQFGLDSDRSTGATTLDVYDNNSGQLVDSNPFVIPNYEEFKCDNGNTSAVKPKGQSHSLLSEAASELSDGNIDKSAISQQLFPRLFDMSDVFSQAKQDDRIARIENGLNRNLSEAQSEFRVRFGDNVIKTPGGTRLEVYDRRDGITVDAVDFVIPDYKFR